MLRLGIAPRVVDIMRGAVSTVDSWFNQATARFNLTQKAGVPVLAEVPTNQWGIFKNTSTSDVALYVNDNGTLKSMLAYTFPITVTGGFSLNFTVTGITSVTLPTTGTLATIAGVETLTNKTLTLPKIAQISNTGTLTLPTSTDTLVGRVTTDTLTNKTLTAPVISTIVNTGTLTLPTATDTLVGRTTTDTLTNKTLTTPVINGTVTGTGVSSTNVVNTLVERDASGNFSAGTITANLTGNADTATKLLSARNINSVLFDGTADITVTAAAGTVTGTTLNSTVVTSSLTTVGTIGTGTWQGTVVAGQYGGTGVANTGKTITLGGSLTTSGAFATTFTMTGITTVTFPTTGTLTTTTGTGATGTWGISISGNAATATTATSATSATTAGSVTNSVTFNNAGTGGASGSTYNGGSALTVSYNTLGAAPLASPTFTGVPAAPTAAVDTNTTQLATTGFVIGQATGTTPLINGTAAVGTETKFARGNHVHPTDTTRAPLASPTFTGTVTVPTVSVTTDITSISYNGGQLAGQRNKIINGRMDIAQRGTSFVAAASGTRGVDRWTFGNSSAAIVTLTQQADAPSSNEFQNSLRVSVTTADTSIAASDVAYLNQGIEGYNIRDLIGRTFTFSFWVRSSKTGTHCVSFRNGIGDRSFVKEYTISVANTWEYKTITVTGGLITAGTWDWTAGLGLSIFFTLSCGSTFQTTAGAWQTGNFIGTVNQVNCTDTVGNIFAITGVQLEIGTAATAFEHRLYTTELTLCRRYYEKSYDYPVAAGLASLGGNSQSTAATAFILSNGSVRYSVEKRTNPTVTIISTNGGTSGSVSEYNAGGVFVADRACSLATNGTTGYELMISGTATVGNNQRWQWTSEAEL